MNAQNRGLVGQGLQLQAFCFEEISCHYLAKNQKTPKKQMRLAFVFKSLIILNKGFNFFS